MKIPIIGSLIDGLFGLGTKYLDNKKQKRLTAAKLKQMKEGNAHEVAMSDKDWETAGKLAEASSWKDEWVTVIVTLPLPMLFLSVFIGVLFNYPEIIDAVNQAIDALRKLVPNYDDLLLVVVLAAIGIKAVKN